MHKLKIIGERVLHEQTWTLLKEKSYLDTGGREGRWTYIERRERRKAAVIVATTERSGSLILIEQFRIPFEAEIFEFPAGRIKALQSVARFFHTRGHKKHLRFVIDLNDQGRAVPELHLREFPLPFHIAVGLIEGDHPRVFILCHRAE